MTLDDYLNDAYAATVGIRGDYVEVVAALRAALDNDAELKSEATHLLFASTSGRAPCFMSHVRRLTLKDALADMQESGK